MNNLMAINNVRGYLDPTTGTAYLNAEDIARGFGFVEEKGGIEYVKLFKIKERAIDNSDGSVRLVRTTLVTGKGQQYFINKFIGQG